MRTGCYRGVRSSQQQCSTCHTVLPTPYLLSLHVSEQHDSFFASQAAQRMPVFQCLVEGCSSRFCLAAQRHQHLTDFHQIPADLGFDRYSLVTVYACKIVNTVLHASWLHKTSPTHLLHALQVSDRYPQNTYIVSWDICSRQALSSAIVHSQSCVSLLLICAHPYCNHNLAACYLVSAKKTTCYCRIHLTAHCGQVRPDGICRPTMADEVSIQSTTVQQQDLVLDSKVQALLQAPIFWQVYQLCMWTVFQNHLHLLVNADLCLSRPVHNM